MKVKATQAAISRPQTTALMATSRDTEGYLDIFSDVDRSTKQIFSPAFCSDITTVLCNKSIFNCSLDVCDPSATLSTYHV